MGWVYINFRIDSYSLNIVLIIFSSESTWYDYKYISIYLYIFAVNIMGRTLFTAYERFPGKEFRYERGIQELGSDF